MGPTQRDSVMWSKGGALVLPPHLSKRLYYSSFLILGSITSSITNNLPQGLCLSALVLCTSLNYWRHPVFGWRRNVDILAAVSSLAFQCLVTSSQAPGGARSAYLFTVGCGGLCYLRSRHIGVKFRGREGTEASSSLWHMGLHVFGNLGNLILYDSLGVNYLGWGS